VLPQETLVSVKDWFGKGGVPDTATVAYGGLLNAVPLTER
jgi:hypothetical protein